MNSCLLDLTKEGFIKRLNEEAGTDLDHTQLELSGEQIPGIAWNSDEDNRTITITPSAGSEYTGSKKISIKAIDGGVISRMFNGTVPAIITDTTDIILERIDTLFGIRIDKDSQATITWNDDKSEGSFSLNQHWGIGGGFVVKLKPLSPMLSSLMDVTALGKPQHNMGTTGEEYIDTANWTKSSYTWDVDFTPCKDMLLNYSAGSTWQAADARTLGERYLAVSRASSTDLSSIGGTQVIAAGKVADAPAEIKPSLNPKFTNYIITPGITSASDKTQAYYIYIHFNA